MQAQRDWPADVAGCKDKFLVQSVASGGVTDFAELFAKGKEGIKESKLRVAYTQPAPPPSPVPEGEEDTRTEDTAATAQSRMPSDVPGLQARARAVSDQKREPLRGPQRVAADQGRRTARGFSLLHLLITGASRLVPVLPSRTFLFPSPIRFFFWKISHALTARPFPLAAIVAFLIGRYL